MADKEIQKIYWDSCCFLAWFLKEPDRCDICDAIIDAAKKQEVKLLTSFLTLAEVSKLRNLYPAVAEDKITDFFRNPYIIKIVVDWFVTRIARDLQTRFSLSPRDSIHLATAIHTEADVLHTYDGDDLLKLDGKIPGATLRISEPSFQYQTKFT